MFTLINFFNLSIGKSINKRLNNYGQKGGRVFNQPFRTGETDYLNFVTQTYQMLEFQFELKIIHTKYITKSYFQRSLN